MLSRGTATLRAAADGGWALGAFATYNLEQVQAVVRAGERTGAPVLLLAGSSHFRHAGRLLATVALAAAADADAEVGVHLDHCRDFAELRWCAELGYTSLMYDGAHDPYEDNVAATAEAVRIAHDHGAWLEGELGALAGDEDVSTGARSAAMTSPEQAADFVGRTGVDALAVAVGNVHGFSPDARLDLDRLRAVRAAVPVPLVLHGASGLPAEQIRSAVGSGVAKINVNAELRRAHLEAVAEALPAALPGSDAVAVWRAGRDAVEERVVAAIRSFGPR
ncbi:MULTISPECIES: class II fructose-bisphosphate aldolase [unclassified Saccharopolyspora]|uniref:class II fructose-bisphosphate aldolase n=1 Tax=unclassified Saccharopolyspora TaxID=2646250 RepID=UPI001CD5DA68|nr:MULTISPECIES: class II fructose-bisphosphate aldolase [unclassified Saccharopolyspora]MCA1184892.1 class II fructose-bisphosphate aldolase [Saccharopolyspora sp. 6T]MCA1190616.1 class II fructose-bisphosphate aldolase [Saccharopolyspora sp. 6V]MCA1279942.1 class II fructose-bisphosphate aldolase [Saccharopolyspora sp. 7B]